MSDAAAGRWTVLELLRWTTDHFQGRGIDTARLDAECLLAHALETTRLQLYVDFEKPVQPAERARFRDLVKRRATDRVPVSQLLGEKEFWSLPFRVGPDVLSPRPDTETVVEAALARLPDAQAPYRILDVGTGSGVIGLTLAHERPQARVTASDISAAALQIARLNADQLQVGDRVRLLEGELFAPVRGERFDLVVSNPPYVARRDAASLPPELAHEPAVALFGGDDGLEILRPLVAEVGEVLVPGGHFVVELDPGQADEVVASCERAGLCEVKVLLDLAGRRRAVAARRPEGAAVVETT